MRSRREIALHQREDYARRNERLKCSGKKRESSLHTRKTYRGRFFSITKCARCGKVLRKEPIKK